MPDRNLVSDPALSQALGVYAGMVSRVLRKPERWLGVDEDPPLRLAYRSGSWTSCVIAFSATSPPPHRAGHPCPSRNALIGGSGGSRSAPPSPRRRPGSPAPWLTAYRCRPPSAPQRPGSPSVSSRTNAGPSTRPTGFLCWPGYCSTVI